MFGPVIITGNAEPGDTLAGRVGEAVSFRDLVKGSEGFQWLRDGQPIKGATEQTYIVQGADVGCALSMAYSFRAHGQDQQVISKPEKVDLGYWRNLYWIELGREPDAEGLAWWQDRVAELFRDGIK